MCRERSAANSESARKTFHIAAHPDHRIKRSYNGLSAASVKHFPYHRARVASNGFFFSSELAEDSG